MPKQAYRLISAIGTPLRNDESLDREALALHLADQWDAGIDGVLVAGTMGAMPLLRDDTYRDLVRGAVECSRGRGEVLIGIGDAGLARSRERLDFVNDYPADGVVALAPHFFPFIQPELTDYYLALANASRAPLFLYQLPQRSRSSIELETALELSRHPNICGIKWSGDVQAARELWARVGDRWRVVVAQPTMLDVLLREGIPEHLDGLFALAPKLVASLRNAAAAGRWDEVRHAQQKLTALAQLLGRFGAMPAFTALLNHRGIPGNYAPKPYRPIENEALNELLADPAVQFLGTEAAIVR